MLPPWLHAQPRRLVTALPTTNFANHYSYRWLCIGPSATESSKAAPKGAQTRIYREPTTKNPIRVYSARAKHAFSERTAGAGRAGARRRMSRHQRARCRQTRKPKRVPPPRATSLPRSKHHAWETATQSSLSSALLFHCLSTPKASLRSRGLHSLTACLLYNTFAGDSTKMSYNAAYINFPFAVVGALPSYWDSTLTPHAKAAIARANDSEGTCQHVKL